MQHQLYLYLYPCARLVHAGTVAEPRTDLLAQISRAAFYWHFSMYHVSIVVAFGSL